MSRSQKTPPPKGLPSNTNAEKVILGSTILDPERHFAAVLAGIQIADFSLQIHQCVYRRMQDIRQRGETLDRDVLAQELQRHDELEGVGGCSYLIELTDLSPIPHLNRYIKLVKKMSDLRRLAHVGDGLRDQAILETDDPGALIAKMRQEFDAMQVQDEDASDEEDASALAFPETAWRGIFADYRAAMRGTTEASDAAHFCTLWAAVAAILGRNIEMHAGDVVYPNVYLCVHGETGDKKTTAERRISACNLFEHWPHIRLERGVGSTEGLATAMAKSETGVCLFFWEEYATFLAHSRWEASTLLQFFVEGFDCPPVWDKPYRQNPIHLETPTPSILTATTADWFWKHAKLEDFYGGVFNRMLFYTGPRKAPLPDPNIWDDEAIRRIKDHLKIIASRASCRAVWTPEAKKTWNAYYVQSENAERSSLLRAATKRAHVYVRKLAMTYAALEQTLPYIDDDQLRAAIAVVEHSIVCAARLLDLRGARNAQDTPIGDLETRILKYAEKFPGRRVRMVQQVMSKYGDAEKFNRAINNLEKADRIERRDKRLYLSI